MSPQAACDQPAGGNAQRIDKWLWHARFARTRGAAQRLATSGHVRLNRERVAAPSRLVRPGDVLTIALGRGVRVVVVRAICARRGSAETAQHLYEDVAGAGRSASNGGDHTPHRSCE